MTEKGKGTVSVARPALPFSTVRHILDSLAIAPVYEMFLYDFQVTPQGLLALDPPSILPSFHYIKEAGNDKDINGNVFLTLECLSCLYFLYFAVQIISKELLVLLSDIEKRFRNVKTTMSSEANTPALITTDSPLGVDCWMLGSTYLVAITVTRTNSARAYN